MTYQVNPFDDVVLCMHPDAERAWRDVVPNAGKVALRSLVVRTPEGAWHRQPLEGDVPATWAEVFAELNAKLRELRGEKARRVHLLVKAPYSLGALIGARLDPQNHELIVYQSDNTAGPAEKVWRPWGPTWAVDPGERAEPFFVPPPGLGDIRASEDGDIAVVVNITGRGDPESCVRAVERCSPRRPVRALLVNARTTGQNAIREPADADKAATELRRLLQDMAETLPRATLHLFYYGPLAVLIRASIGLGFRRTPIIVHEAVYPDGKPWWVPAIRFPEGRLLIGAPATGPVEEAPRGPMGAAAGGGAAVGRSGRAIRIFVLHAKEDIEIARRLEQKPPGASWEVWHRGMVRPGEREDQVLARELGAADIALVVVSKDLFDDVLAYPLLQGAAETERAGRLRLVPLLGRESFYKSDPILGGRKALPDGERWLGTARNDRLWAEVDEALHGLVCEMKSGLTKRES